MAEQPIVDKVMRETMLKTGVVDLQGFFNLIRHNDMKEMEKKLGEANIKVVGGANCWDDYGTYPVHMAAAEGHTDMLCLLIEYGAEVDQQTTLEHRTALHFAVINKSHAAVRYLIDVGARTDIKDIYQKTARMYAVDEDAMRVVFEGETINKHFQDFHAVLDRLMRMSNIRTRKPRPDESQRIPLTYELYAKNIEELNLKNDLTLPIPNTPGSQTVKREIEQMRKKKHGETIYLAVVPREEMGTSNNKPFTSFIKLTFAQFYRGERAVCIEDIYVNKNDRKHYHGTMLLAAAVEYVLRGPHPPPKRLFKLFCCVPEQNAVAVKFFSNAGFARLPPHGVPPRFRRLGNIVFTMNHVGLYLDKVTKALKPGLHYDRDWVTSQQLEERRLKELQEAEERDMSVFNKRLDAFLVEREVPRMKQLLANVAGDPILPLGVAEPPDPERDADRIRVLRTLERRRQTAVNSMVGLHAKDRPKEPKYTCENDRVPEAILKVNGDAILRMRELHRWKHEIEGSRINNSKILACPDILRDAWLDELEYDALLALPDEWIKRKDDNGDPVYFNKITHKTTPNRPKRKGKLESRHEANGDDDKEGLSDLNLDAALFGGSIEEMLRAKEEAEKKRIKDRRLWEREMDQVLDKALSQSESLVSFMHRMKIFYPQDKADEIILKARQAMEASARVQGTDLKVEQAIKKGDFLQGTKDLFKTPLQKAKDVKKQIQAANAKVLEEKMQAKEEVKSLAIPAENPQRPNSAQVSAAAFGSPKRQRHCFPADSPAQSSPAQAAGGISIKESISSANKKAKHSDEVTKPLLLGGHTSDAAADWIQRAAEREQAMHDADSMLEMFAPPSGTFCYVTATPPRARSSGGNNLELASSSVLSPVIESPQKHCGGTYLGHETAIVPSQTSIEPFSAHKVHVVSRPATGMSLASTVLRPRGPPSRSTAGTSMFGLDGVSRPQSMEGLRPRGPPSRSTAGSSMFGLDGVSRPQSQDGVGFGLDEESDSTVVDFRPNMHPRDASTFVPLSSKNLLNIPPNAASTFVPWGSNLLNPSVSGTPSASGALEGVSRPASVASSSSALRLCDVSSSSTPLTSLLGLEGVSRPDSREMISLLGLEGVSRPGSRESSRTGSRPVSSTSMRPEWNVPWRMGSAGKRSASARVMDSSRVASSTMGLDDDSRPSSSSSYMGLRPMSSTRNITEAKGLTSAEQHLHRAPQCSRRRSIVEGALTIFPSINSSKETKDGKGVGGVHERRSLLEPPRDHVRQCEEVEASPTVGTGGPARPQSAAANPKILRFAQETYRPQSAAVTPSRMQQQEQKHL